MLSRRMRKATSSIFYHLYYGYLAQRAKSESRSAQIDFVLHAQSVLLRHSRTTTQHAERSHLREVIYVTLTDHGYLSDLFKLKGYEFESEHVSFDKYRSGGPEFHISIRYKKENQHIVVRIDFECVNDQVQRSGAISIKQYSNSEFFNARPVDFEIDNYKELIEDHARTYFSFFENLFLGKLDEYQRLIQEYGQLEARVAQGLHLLHPDDRDSNLAQSVKAGLLELLALIDKVNNYSSNGELIGKTFILERMAYFEEIIIAKVEQQEVPAEEVGQEISFGITPPDVETPLSYEEKLVAELLKILPEIESSKNNAISSANPQAVKHYENTVDTFSIVLTVLDIISESESTRALVGMHKKALLFNQDVVRSYHEIEQQLLRTPAFKSTAQNQVVIAFVRAIAEEIVRDCESECLDQTVENKVNCFSQACARLRASEESEVQSMIDAKVIVELVKNLPLDKVLLEVGNYLNHPEVVCDYIRTKQPTISEIYVDRHECEKFPYAEQLANELKKQGHENPEVIAQEMLNGISDHAAIVFYLKGLDIKSRKKINCYLTEFVQRLTSGGPDGKESVRDTFCTVVEEIKKDSDSSHASCMTAQWLFSILLPMDRRVNDYINLLSVFNVLQQRQNGLKPVNYFLKASQVFLQYLPKEEKAQVIASSSYISFKDTYAAQLRVCVEEEKEQRSDAGAVLGSACSSGTYTQGAEVRGSSEPSLPSSDPKT